MKIIEELYSVIEDRKLKTPEDSYVASLMSSGKEKILEKIEEESGEVIDAAQSGTNAEIIHELSDLLFHMLVLMNYLGITPDDVQTELKQRRQ